MHNADAIPYAHIYMLYIYASWRLHAIEYIVACNDADIITTAIHVASYIMVGSLLHKFLLPVSLWADATFL